MRLTNFLLPYILIFLLGCSASPEKRVEIVESLGTVIYQQYKGIESTNELFIIKQGDNYKIVCVSRMGTIYRIEYLDIGCD